MPVIEEIHAESGGAYGARRIARALRRKGCRGGRHPRAAPPRDGPAALGPAPAAPGRDGPMAFVLDVYSLMIAGWQIAGHMRTELPPDALEMELWRIPGSFITAASASRKTCPFGMPTGSPTSAPLRRSVPRRTRTTTPWPKR
ncbi:IS3 family transposase [Streptomyces sp. SID13726]|nr:IS3 family transposase [Streptomyces sp. SID13726]